MDNWSDHANYNGRISVDRIHVCCIGSIANGVNSRCLPLYKENCSAVLESSSV